jgi:hypothetical protein
VCVLLLLAVLVSRWASGPSAVWVWVGCVSLLLFVGSLWGPWRLALACPFGTVALAVGRGLSSLFSLSFSFSVSFSFSLSLLCKTHITLRHAH